MNQQQIYWAYATLGLNVYATEAQAKHAYRLLCKQYHPDRNNSTEALQMYLQIQQAYEIVCNAITSASYVPTNTPNVTNSCRIFGNSEAVKHNYNQMRERQSELKRLHRWETASQKEKELQKQQQYKNFQSSRKLPSQQEKEKWKQLETKREAERIAAIIEQLIKLN